VAYSPDGRFLATASSDRTAQLITLKTLGQLLERGQTIATRRLSQEECTQYLRGEPCLMAGDP
jgi:WD40 repeat protein